MKQVVREDARRGALGRQGEAANAARMRRSRMYSVRAAPLRPRMLGIDVSDKPPFGKPLQQDLAGPTSHDRDSLGSTR
jgi:hypothetical protein